ncbi:MAG: transposase [Lachnospiraceae bacterium]
MYLTKYHYGISGGDAHAVIDVLDQISGVAVNRYFHQFSPVQRQQVKYFCCDMSNGLVSIAKKNFPNVRICIDSFHVITKLNDMVDQVGLRYQNQFKNTGGMANFQKIKGIARLLKTKEINQQKYYLCTNFQISSLIL